MNQFFHRSLAVFLVTGLFLVQGCAFFDEKTQVRNYNNAIVDLQQKMLKKNQDAAAGLTLVEDLEPTQALQEMEKVLAEVQQSYKEFQNLKVPKGGEDLSAAMKNFFEVEIGGVTNIIDTLRMLAESKQKDKTFEALLKTADEFTVRENEALKQFDEAQKTTATKYGEKIEITPAVEEKSSPSS